MEQVKVILNVEQYRQKNFLEKEIANIEYRLECEKNITENVDTKCSFKQKRKLDHKNFKEE